MTLPSVFNTLNSAFQKTQIDQLLTTNIESAKNNLLLSTADVAEIIEARQEILTNYGRVELDLELIQKLILSFCHSPFITQENYVSTLIDLLEVFYYIKNETTDQIGDDEIIALLEDFYNTDCGGSLELLVGREIEEFCRQFRQAQQINPKVVR